MSFKASLVIEGKTFRVLSCHYAFNQFTDSTGRPVSNVKGGTIDIEVESSGDLTLAQWTVSPNLMKDGSLIFYKRDGEQRMKEISFKQAYMVSYAEAFSNFGETPMIERVTVSAKEIKVQSGGGGEVLHKNVWPE
ncbi:MAG: phage tail protein [Bacteroidetes bacterium]|nr:phage tail protein [Bacteroidota bacterium]